MVLLDECESKIENHDIDTHHKLMQLTEELMMR